MLRMRVVATALVLVALTTLPARAEVGDPTLRTDHPQYPGEGAFQTVEDCVAFATAGAKTPQDKALALYKWILTHQWHLASPQEWNVPGVQPDTAKDGANEMIVYDANRARFSYGYGLCGTVHAWNEPYWRALGMQARRRSFPGHTNSEVEYAGSWHAFDTDMAGLVFRPDGVVAGYEDIKADPKAALRPKPPLPCYPFAWPGDFETMKAGWKEVASGGNWYKMYSSGYAAQPGIVHLRSGETFTRYFDRDHYGGPDKRRFWHHMKGGPERDWSFFGQAEPTHNGEKNNSHNKVSYCNGEFVYEPDLKSESFREGLSSHNSNLTGNPGGGGLRSSDGNATQAAFEHWSPYVICGDPADDANPQTGPATGGLVVEGNALGKIAVQISTNSGQSWQAAGSLEGGPFKLDLTNHVKGHYGWSVQFNIPELAELDALRFTTVTQVCAAMYPQLKPGGSTVTYHCGSRGVIDASPDFSLPANQLEGPGRLCQPSPNIVYTPRSAQSRLAYQVRGPKPADVVFTIPRRQPLTEVAAAVRYGVRVPPPERNDFNLTVSFDDGATWQPLARGLAPADNEYSSGWMYGHAHNEDGLTYALVKAHLDADGTQTGIMQAELYGTYRTAPPQAVTITYGWREDGEAKTYEQAVAAGTEELKFTVPTGEKIEQDFVRIAAK